MASPLPGVALGLRLDQRLAKMRDEIRGTNQRLDRVEATVREQAADVRGMREDIHGMRGDMGAMRDDIRGLVQALDARDRRFAAEVSAVDLYARVDLRSRVEACEREIAELKRKVEPR